MRQAIRQELLKLVKDNYRSIAAQFSQTRSKMPWPELVNLAESINHSDGVKKILDVGCGNGHLLDVFNSTNIDYLGVDNCPELITLAKEKYPQAKFTEADILKLYDLPDINFDYVFSIAVISHLPSFKLRLEALKQLKNKVKSGGTIYLSTWNLWTKKKYRDLIIKFFILKLLGKHGMDTGDIVFDWRNPQGEIVSQRYYHAFTLRELRKLAGKAGLKIDKVYKDKYNYYLVATK